MDALVSNTTKSDHVLPSQQVILAGAVDVLVRDWNKYEDNVVIQAWVRGGHLVVSEAPEAPADGEGAGEGKGEETPAPVSDDGKETPSPVAVEKKVEIPKNPFAKK